MSAHSPGPWRHVTTHPAEPNLVVDANGEYVVRHCVAGGRGLVIDETDARLIAAAPALLEALKTLLGQVHADCLREGEEVAVEAAEALIARVEAGG